jgi:hypothetical protein
MSAPAGDSAGAGETRGRSPAEFSIAARLPVSHCANPHCATGWLHLWRSRKFPVFEGGWACSPGCMAERVRSAVRRESAMGDAAPYRHRIPLGLLLVDQGQITPEQLQEAGLHREPGGATAADSLRLGRWLVDSGILSETALARALSAQWNCPVFSGAFRPRDVASALPRFLSAELGALPLRVTGGRLLSLAFRTQISRSLAYALERMLGLRVFSGIMRDSEFREAQAQFLDTPGPRAHLLETSSRDALVGEVVRRIEEQGPAEARLVEVHDAWWLRLWRRPPAGRGLPASDDVEDILCTVGEKFRAPG